MTTACCSACISPTDIAQHDMQFAAQPYLENVPVFNLLSVLEGHLVGDASNLVDSVSGEIVVALPAPGAAPFRQGLHRAVRPAAGHDPPGAGLRRQLPDPLPGAAARGYQRRGPRGHLHPQHPAGRLPGAHLLFQAAPVERICQKGNLEHVHL